jgi:hypothetical protein
MSNKRTRSYRRKTNKRTKTNKTSKRNRRSLGKGMSPNAPVQCSMCEKNKPRDNTLVPVECLIKHREKAHRICESCWWNPDAGFARENASHKCPGCKKGLPLTEPLKKRTPREEEIIILSS